VFARHHCLPSSPGAALYAFAKAAAQPAPEPRVLLFFSLSVEADHMLFATDAIRFFAEEGTTTDFA
jgi:hypothetical protein